MIDWTVILTGVGTVLAVVGANITLISWLRSDIKNFELDIKNDMKSFSSEIRNELKLWREQIQAESKDFHVRLCTIEEKIQSPKTNP